MDASTTSGLDDSLIKSLSDIVPSTKDGKALIPAMLEVMKNFQERLGVMFGELKTELINAGKEREMKIVTLEEEVRVLKKTVSYLQDKADDQEAYDRREQMIISGPSIPAFQTGEICSSVVTNLLRDKLNINVSVDDISVSHRLGRASNSQGPDRRNIIVKFCRRERKSDVLRACRLVKPQGFFANESLTPVRRTISHALRKAKKDFAQISGTTTIDGSVYVWVKPPNPNAAGARDTRVTVNTMAKLHSFFENTLGGTLENYVTQNV